MEPVVFEQVQSQSEPPVAGVDSSPVRKEGHFFGLADDGQRIWLCRPIV